VAGTRDIELQRGVEPIRERPEMYVGDLAGEGLYNLIWGLVAHYFDHRSPSGPSSLSIEIDRDSTVTIRDDGHGIPIEYWERPLERQFATMQGRLLGVPPQTIASALSETLVVATTREGERWTQPFARGIPTSEMVSLGGSAERGTMLRFRPDPVVFPSIDFDHAQIADRLRAIAWLCSPFAISWQGERLESAGGIARWVDLICDSPIEARISTWLPDARVNLALAWRGSGAPILRSFANSYETVAGPHLDAFWTQLTGLAARALEVDVDADHVRERLEVGLVGIVHVMLPDPFFQDGTHTTLRSPGAATQVERGFASIELTAPLRRFLLARLL